MTQHNITILAGDIGGTNARFACLKPTTQGGWTVCNFVKLQGSDYSTFYEALDFYMDSLDVRPRQAAFSAAGPVKAGYVNVTNSAWEISADRTIERFGLEVCELYNDFAGMTRSIPELSDPDFEVIRSGKALTDAPILVAGPGTGFGVGHLVPTQIGYHVISTEGGFQSYSPQTQHEMELLKILQRDHEFVSLELVSSGRGLPIIHKAICEMHGKTYISLHPDKIRELADIGDSICSDICSIRAAATMGAIGDLALSGGTRGGIILAGGVSERMIKHYKTPDAMHRFLNRAQRSDYIAEIPIKLLKSPLAPLIGAAALLKDHIGE
ncbi:MAG: glucokinase [Hellea sp.]